MQCYLWPFVSCISCLAVVNMPCLISLDNFSQLCSKTCNILSHQSSELQLLICRYAHPKQVLVSDGILSPEMAVFCGGNRKHKQTMSSRYGSGKVGDSPNHNMHQFGATSCRAHLEIMCLQKSLCVCHTCDRLMRME